MTDTIDETTSTTRTFMLVTIAGSLAAWEIGFDLGAFETISYRRVFTVFIISTVVLLTTLVRNDETRATSPMSRCILGLPLIYLVAEMTFLTVSQTVVDILNLAIILTFPWTLYVIARLVDRDYFTLPRREQAIAVIAVLLSGLSGLYVGTANDRFLSCDDFERSGDFQPDNCRD
jgi:hypothetical protein